MKIELSSIPQPSYVGAGCAQKEVSQAAKVINTSPQNDSNTNSRF